jgi:hypothetical protein
MPPIVKEHIESKNNNPEKDRSFIIIIRQNRIVINVPI